MQLKVFTIPISDPEEAEKERRCEVAEIAET
jgi:hypothetical protein